MHLIIFFFLQLYVWSRDSIHAMMFAWQVFFPIEPRVSFNILSGYQPSPLLVISISDKVHRIR